MELKEFLANNGFGNTSELAEFLTDLMENYTDAWIMAHAKDDTRPSVSAEDFADERAVMRGIIKDLPKLSV